MLTIEELISSAQQETGLSDLGDNNILKGLTVLISALNQEAPLNERGRQSVRNTLLKNLTNRLRLTDYLNRHPQLLDQPVTKPLFVFGLPRTGTTLLINLLHEDPARRSLLRWEALNSVPPPKASELSTDPRCLKEQAMVDMSLQYAPHISAIHHENSDSPTECQFAMSQSFCAQYYEAIAEIPSYREWFLQADYAPAFRYHKRLLQLLQSEAPGRWTLKNPWHPLYLNALTEVYPDAQLVMTHRDPVAVVASCCSLIKHVRAMLSDKVDTHSIGRTMVETFEIMVQRTLAYKNTHGQDSIYDLQYADLVRDPIGEIKKLYQHFGEPLTSAAESAMRAYLANNPQGKHGHHGYSLEEYGLNKALIRERFANYCQQFNIPQQADRG